MIQNYKNITIDIFVPRLWDSIENSNRFFNDRPN